MTFGNRLRLVVLACVSWMVWIPVASFAEAEADRAAPEVEAEAPEPKPVDSLAPQEPVEPTEPTESAELPESAVPAEPVEPPTPPEPPPSPPPLPLPDPVPLLIGPREESITPTWLPPLHDPAEKDWLQLTSGEWLHGEIEQINDDTVYFDSQELDDLEIDWEDISSLRSPRHNTYRFTDQVIVTGTAGMHGDVIRIDTGNAIREFPRNELFSAIEGELREINYWSLDLGLSMSVRSGNSDQVDVDIRAEVMRQTPLTEFNVSYQSAYGVVDTDEVTNNQRLSGLFAYYLSRRVFVNVPTVEFFRDRLQNIDLRSTAGASLGYDVYISKRADWSIALGASFERTEYDSVPVNEDAQEDDGAVTFSTTLELDPTANIEWDTTYRLAAVVTDLDKTNHHIQSVLSIDLFGPLDLDITFNLDRIEKPRQDDDGNTPESNDVRLTVGLSLDL